MLSPASLRVCCLAVMAPALTKADRRADCLPVVLPEPFYFSKTVDTFNSEDNNNHITFSTLNFKTAWQPSFNKSFMNKVWWRSGDRTKLLISNNIRYSAVEFRRHWALSSRLRLNVAPKCCKPWLYSKGFSTLADKLRLKYCTMNKNNLTNRSMGLAKANASLGLHDLKKMRKISQLRHKEDTTILESDGESSPDIRDSTNSDFQDETLVTVVSPVSKGILNKNHLSDHDCDVFSPSSSLDGLQSDSFSQTDSLRVIGENRPKECQLSNNSELELGSVVASSLQSNSVVSPAENNSGVDAFTVVVNNCSGPSSVESCDTSNKVLSVSVDLQQSSSVTEKPVENVNEQETISQLPSIFLEPQEKSPNPLLCNFVNEIPLLLDSPDFLLNASHSFENIGNTYLRLPNQLLDVINWEKSTQSRKKRQQMKSNQICCKLTLNENENFSKLISGREEKLKLAVVQFQLRKCKQLNLHVRKQMQHFVEHFQKKLGITCQMQVDPSHLRPEKDLVDIKTEILQSENVKSLSTAALVNLVRNIESNTIPDNLLPQQKTEMQNVDEPSDKSNVFDPEDFVEIKHTSKFLRNSMKKWLRSVDSDMTDESSDEESVHWVFQKMALDTHSSRNTYGLAF
ncbi:uncharacterized protein LOC129235309 isoform X1 [Uloborus diversus]|uniref:uncharacterized protein LOC129235309 isoform X1 n=1 Tax=Uloborus diversus TaxID=327109 RepID=UPI00240997E3|nr:uncharacterized protein LOC129235309 isoform X1 [Uloborus diversus]